MGSKKQLRRGQEMSFFGMVNDSISFPDEINGENQKAVFLSFENLHRLLFPLDLTLDDLAESDYRRYRLNSRIISLTLGDGPVNLVERPSRVLTSPVRITLHRLRPTDKDVCAFWSVPTQTWSSQGCKVISSDEEAVVCQCGHLTAFALLTPSESVSGVSDLSGHMSVVRQDSGFTTHMIIYVAAVGVSVLIILLILIQVSEKTLSKLSKILTKTVSLSGAPIFKS